MLRRVVVLVSLISLFASPSAIVAQSGTWSLSAKPRGDSHVAPAGASGGVVVFYVTNTGTELNRVRFSCGGRDGVTCEALDVTRLNLEPGESTQVVATISVGTTSGTVTFQADGRFGSSAEAEWPVTVVETAAGAGSVAAAQCGEECGGGGTTYGVEVGNPGPVTKPVNSGPYTAYFSVYNSGSTSNTYSLLCSTFGGVTCVSVTPFSMTLQSLDDNAAAVTYNVGSTSGTLRLKATGTQATDIGSMVVTAVAEGPPIVAITNRNDDNWDRSMCLVAGAGPGASVCGDLLISHGMPGFQTLGRERALTLVYSSHQAAPEPLVAATVSTPAGNANPTSVHADLWVLALGSDLLVRSADYTAWTGTGERQLALSFDASGYATGAYQYSLTVTYVYPGGSYSTIAYGTVVIVNRSQSPLGQGWSVAGVEELYFNQPAWTVGATGILWVGGDGSAKLYSQVPGTTDRWVAPMGAYRDTIVDTGAGYSRYLRHGVEVTYDGTGKHLKTINRVGQETVFAWPSGRLGSITVPPEGVSGRTYTLTYDGNNKLDKITDPGGRILDATVSGGRITSLKDPDNITLTFGYNGDGRMISHKNRGGYTTAFSYASGLHLTKVDVPYGPTGATLATTTFEPWDHKGFASSGSGPFAAQTTSTVYTKVVGPRLGINDDAKFWVDRWGAPTRIEDALNNVTVIERADNNLPALVTKVTHPTGLIDTLAYNGRGNLTYTRQISDTLPSSIQAASKIARFTYGDADAPDSPDSVISVLGSQNRATRYFYNSHGVPDSTISRRDHTTQFIYESWTSNLKGQLKEIIDHDVTVLNESSQALVSADLKVRLGYDGLGNLAWDSTSPGALKTYQTDGLGRVTASYGPLGAKDSVSYDNLNRMLVQHRYTAAATHPSHNPYWNNPRTGCSSLYNVCGDSSTAFLPTSVVSTQYYWGAFGVDSILDPRGVKRSFSYDARGAVYAERDEAGMEKASTYGPSGLVLSIDTRDSTSITHSYDLLGRDTLKVVPARSNTLPLGGGVTRTTPVDSVTYQYDAMGNVTRMENRHAIVRQGFYADGTLRYKVSQLLFGSHGVIDSIHYQYNDAGDLARKILLGKDTVDYAYDSSGDLASMTVKYKDGAGQQTKVFNFSWDELGRRNQIAYPDNITVDYVYGSGGVLRRVISNNTNTPNNDRFDFTYRNREVDVSGNILRQTSQCSNTGGEYTDTPCDAGGFERISRYNRLGWLSSQETSQVEDSMRYDKSGNLTYKRRTNGPVYRYYYNVPAASNRMDSDSSQSGNEIRTYYTGSGSRWYQAPPTVTLSNANTVRGYYYDGLGRADGFIKGEWAGSFGWQNNPGACKYYPDNSMLLPCDPSALPLAFDGSNPTIAIPALDRNWRFIHAPGVDEPLMGFVFHEATQTVVEENYYVTDGAGRQLATGKANGGSPLTVGWQMAGGARQAQTFDAERMNGANIPEIAYFRHRAYDARTGRWTQEDPIGVAGGLNLYAFNGNNPVANTDPFGLMPDGCPPRCRITNWDAFGDHVVPDHIRGGGGNQFSRGMSTNTVKRVISQTVTNGTLVAEEIAPGGQRFLQFEKRWSNVGSKGEQIVRAVITPEGDLRTAFPQRNWSTPPALARRAAGRGRRLRLPRGTGKVLRGIGAGLSAVAAIFSLGPGATPLH